MSSSPDAGLGWNWNITEILNPFMGVSGGHQKIAQDLNGGLLLLFNNSLGK